MPLTQNDLNRLNSYLSRFKIFIKKYNPTQFLMIDSDIDDLAQKIETCNKVLKNSITSKQQKISNAHIDDSGKVTYK